MYIDSLIPVARQYVDSVTGRVSITSGWLLSAPTWASLVGCGRTLSVNRTPLVSVESISYYASGEDVLTVMDAADYRVITTREPGIIQITGSMPALEDRPDAIQIAFTAGYEFCDDVPAVHKHAIKMLVNHLYDNRLPVAFASCQELPFSLRTFIENQKVGGWIG